MISFVSGISTTIPSRYEEIIRRLKMFGLSPTGNPELDKSRLQAEINRRVEKVEEVKKEEKKQEERAIEKQLEEERLGAKTLANRTKSSLDYKLVYKTT